MQSFYLQFAMFNVKNLQISHKSAAHVKNHDKSRQTPKFTANTKIHSIREFVV